jgi:hypothetical protein
VRCKLTQAQKKPNNPHTVIPSTARDLLFDKDKADPSLRSG